MRYHLLLLSMLGLLATATQATAQNASREFWTENSAAAGAPVLASPGQAEIAVTAADSAWTIPALSDDALTKLVAQAWLVREDFAVTHHLEPMGAFRRKRK